MTSLPHEVFAGASEPVLAIHGISSNRRLWQWLHRAVPQVTLLAPDLRGRADSVDLGGPFGLSQHVDDLVALLDRQGLGRVSVIGMSMGGFIGVALAAAHPDRVRSLVLVDGGPPMEVPAGFRPETMPVVFSCRIAQLRQRWETLQEYRDHFCDDVAPLLDTTDPLLLAYLAHDLQDGRVRLDPQALLQDGTQIYFGDNAFDRLEVPVRFLHAEWSIGVDSRPVYSREQCAAIAGRGTPTTLVPGVDHAGIVMTDHGARAVGDVVLEVVDGQERVR